jgi:demethylmenaquinone methyltransferase/2-methoxy-6-polyprenyl-1,4-benzoquinol methylase
MIKKNIWIAEEKKDVSQSGSQAKGKVAYFGYESVSEEEKTRRVLKHFNSVADCYDFMNTLLSFGIHHAWKRQAVRAMNLNSGDFVIDVCGGTGDLSILAAKRNGPAGRVVIYDINKAMMDAGRKKNTISFLKDRIRFVLGNAESIAFPENTFDAAMVGFGIRNVTRLVKGFEEMHRVLKPGGTLMCLEFSKPTMPFFRALYDFYSFRVMPFIGELIAGSRQAYTHLPESIRTFPMPDKLSEILEKIGFENVTYRGLTNGISVIHLGTKR